MTKNIQLTVGLIAVVTLVAGFLVRQYTRDVYVEDFDIEDAEEIITLLRSVPAGEVTGIITNLSGNTLTLAPNFDDFGVPEDMPETLIYTLAPDTKVIRYVRADGTETYQKAMAAYTEAMANDPESMAMPPAPFEAKEFAQEILTAGQTVSVAVSSTKEGDYIVAESVVIRRDESIETSAEFEPSSTTSESFAMESEGSSEENVSSDGS